MSRSRPADDLLHGFFDRRWRDWPLQVAVDIPPGRGRPERVQLTYADLARESDDAADILGPLITRESVVALLLPRTSAKAYVFELGTLRAGGAYTAIDPTFPDDRVRAIVDDLQPVAFVTDTDGLARAGRLGLDPARIINAETLAASDLRADVQSSCPPCPPCPPWLTPATLAYVIYTSGTTGQPKGVMIEHRAIANLVGTDVEEFRLSPGDRVGHGSSHAYDSSVEEIWLALAAGATVVVIDDDELRAGPDLIEWLARERISVLCPPPTLLRTMGGREAAHRLKGLSLLYVGGEALPRDVADDWSVGRRLVNGYGPTECAVTALRADVRAGEPITIGRPIAGLSAWIVDGDLRELADGERGELCLGGVGLARGYRHGPAEAARSFPVHPQLGRVYRTGDLASRDAHGVFHYHGRIDAQVKLRGYRIELEDIESHLVRAAGVREAACQVQTDDGRQRLVAFVVPTDPAVPPAAKDLRSALGQTLPPYMVPSQFGFLAALPTTTGGKVDRAALPVMERGDSAVPDEPLAAGDTAESLVEAELRTVLGWPRRIWPDQDFFADLGGDSLAAAGLVSALRRHPATSSITVRDIYEAPTIYQMTKRIRERVPHGAAPPAGQGQVTGARPILVSTCQAVWLLGEFAVAGGAGYALALQFVPWLVQSVGLLWTIASAPALLVAGGACYAATTLAGAVVIKRLLIGRYRARREAVWSTFYLRHWVVQHVARLVPWSLMSGTELQAVALRALGARIGQRVHIHRSVDLTQGGWDLLEIGDGATIGCGAELRVVDVDAGHLVVAPITLGRDVTLDLRSGVGGHGRLEVGAYLSAHASLPAGGHVPPGEHWDGIPARRVGRAPERPVVTSEQRSFTPFQYAVLLLMARMVTALLLALPMAGVAAGLVAGGYARAADVADWLASPAWTASLMLAVMVTVAIVPVTVAWQALLVRALGPIAPGVIDRWSWDYARVWIKTGLVEAAGDWLSGSLLWPVWLRASGMTIGPGCEISTIIDVVPEHIAMGRTCFLADGIYLGGPHVHRGTVRLAHTSLGDDVFVGNHAVIECGRRIADGVLIGISTVAADGAAERGTSWFGHPPFALQRRAVQGYDRRLTHEPRAIRYVNRLCWEWLRATLPLVPLFVVMGWAYATAAASAALGPWTFLLLAVPGLTLAAASATGLFVIALKWGLLGRVAPGEHPLWSCWCSRWDFLYVVWAQLARPLVANIEGTLWLHWYLRAAGARIGRRVVLGRGFAQLVDPDMLHIEDGSTVQALFQAHTFEDRVLKIDRIRIGPRACIGSGVVLLYGADVGAGASVRPHSVVMKREHLLPGRTYEGCPTQEVR